MRSKMRVAAATLSACALAFGSVGPAMADGGKHDNKKKRDRHSKVVNIQTNVAIVNQTAVAINLGDGIAAAANSAKVTQTNK